MTPDALTVARLIASAQAVRRNAYAPYSHFQVGAALLSADGRIFTGCNVENAAYPVGLCAERAALSAAVAAGCRQFSALAIVGGAADAEPEQLDFTPPCGMCRQWLSELCPPDLPVILSNGAGEQRVYTAAELLPGAFQLG